MLRMQLQGLSPDVRIVPGDYPIVSSRVRLPVSQEPGGSSEQSFEVVLSLVSEDQQPAVLRVR